MLDDHDQYNFWKIKLNGSVLLNHVMYFSQEKKSCHVRENLMLVHVWLYKGVLDNVELMMRTDSIAWLWGSIWLICALLKYLFAPVEEDLGRFSVKSVDKLFTNSSATELFIGKNWAILGLSILLWLEKKLHFEFLSASKWKLGKLCISLL